MKTRLFASILCSAFLSVSSAHGQYLDGQYDYTFSGRHDSDAAYANAWYGTNNFYSTTNHLGYVRSPGGYTYSSNYNYGTSVPPFGFNYGEPDPNPYGDWYDYGEHNPDEWMQDWRDFDQL